MARVVKAGDDIRKGVTASWFNEQNKRRTQAKPNSIVHIPENPVKVGCIASSGITLDRFEAANIVAPAIPYEDFDGNAVQYSTVAVKVNDTLTENKWGIVQGPCTQDNPSKLVVLGITWALFDYTDGHTHVDIVGGALTSGTSGKGIILSAPEEAGKPGLILIRGGGGGDSDAITIKTPEGGIPACTGTGPWNYGSATCKIVTTSAGTGTLTSTDQVVYNIVNQEIAGNVIGKAELVSGSYIIDVASCGV